MQKILVIAPQYIGDSILAIPFLRELRAFYKEAQIDVVTKNAGRLVFSNCPYINNVYEEKDLKKRFYDKAYVLKRSLSAALLAKKLGIKDTIGFGGQFREFVLKKTIKYKAWEKHELEHFMDVLKTDGIEINGKSLEYWAEIDSVKNVQKYFTGKKPALIVTSSSTTVKDWTVKGFQEVIDYLNENNYECFIFGTQSEKAYNEQFLNVKNLCGELNFQEIIALISQMDIVFGVDSGFCHMACAFDKKVVALFGSTSKVQWDLLSKNSEIVSLSLPCSPCKKAKKCNKGFECMKNISSKLAIEALKKYIEE